ncbi:DUF2252 family protein [Schlesneria paludicola]|uniref:DUF2252 family protein n=1 Tax=Schlesneria paludicola TaxID=360056 RepID=UPI00029AA9CB|nr:DUF2252 family protein [Schlesneria paludicola]
MSVFGKIIKFNSDRDPSLLKVKFDRMSVSPFAFFRGTNHLFVDIWSDLSPPAPGPSILICGDLHVENFGAFRTENGNWCFGINDFDDASIAACSMDIVRCASSILLAAVDWKLSPVDAAGLVLIFLDEYRATIVESQHSNKIGRVDNEDGKNLIGRVLGSHRFESHKRMIAGLTNRRGNKIRRDKRLRPALFEWLAARIKSDVQDYLQSKKDLGGYCALDVTGRIAGIGSVGNERYVALIATQAKKGKRLLDIKLAVQSPISDASKQAAYYSTEAERIVIAQRQIQGENTVGLDFAEFQSKSFRVREMVPDENRCQIDCFREKPTRLSAALKVIGRVVGWSQLRGAKFGTFDRQGELENWARGANLDAVLKSSVRYAKRTTEDLSEFTHAYRRERLHR